MKRLLLLVSLLLLMLSSSAQGVSDSSDLRLRNSVSFQILGEASLFSFGYERIIAMDSLLFLTAKVGAGYNSAMHHIFDCILSECPPKNYLTIPYHLTLNVGKTSNFFEFGIGGAYISGETNAPFFFYPIIGYRLWPIKNRSFNFRIYALYPITGYDDIDIWVFPGGFSVGYCF